MRFVSFDKNGDPTLGVHIGDQVVDLSIAAPGLPKDLKGMLEAGDQVMEQANTAAQSASVGAKLPFASISFHPPIANSSKIICLGLNYADHAAESGMEKPKFPTLFCRFGTSLVGHLQPVIRPKCSTLLDYEAELVAVIGKKGRHLSESDALSIVAGYSVFNDGSVRDYQMRTTQWTMGKNFDASGPCGPEFVTADELPPGASGLKIQARLNGEVLQDDNTENMVFNVSETIAILTEALTLLPGDMLVMGTPSGVGAARKPPVWMKDGDTIEIEIDKIGVLTNPVVDEK